MSKIGRKPIHIPQGVLIKEEEGIITITGPKGALQRSFPSHVVHIEQEGEVINVTSEDGTLWGTWRAHIANMIKGVTQGFEKKLDVLGIGYKVSMQESTLVLQVGFSHLVKVEIPADISCQTKDNSIILQGIDKERVGQFAASLRAVRPPDSYKGKGIRYSDEIVKLKPGKKAGVGAKA